MKKVQARKVEEKKDDTNILCALAWFLAPISSAYLIAEKKYHSNKDLMLCAWQSLILSIAYFALRFTVFGIFFWGIGKLVDLLYVVFILYATYKGYQGEVVKAPIVGELAESQVEKMSK